VICLPFDGPVDMDALITAKQISDYANVSLQVVCNWRRRGLLPVATDEHGQEITRNGQRLYRFRDAARADSLSAQRSQKMARDLLRRAAAA
jgi:DNA-binding transcriptional MerR regulator